MRTSILLALLISLMYICICTYMRASKSAYQSVRVLIQAKCTSSFASHFSFQFWEWLITVVFNVCLHSQSIVSYFVCLFSSCSSCSASKGAIHSDDQYNNNNANINKSNNTLDPLDFELPSPISHCPPKQVKKRGKNNKLPSNNNSKRNSNSNSKTSEVKGWTIDAESGG